jgi:hypothetical protein
MGLAMISAFLLGFAGVRIVIGKADPGQGCADDCSGARPVR